MAANTDETVVFPCHTPKYLMPENRGHLEAGENSCIAEEDMQPNCTNLCFETSTISAKIVIAGQQVRPTVDICTTISFLAKTFAQQLEQRYRRTTHRENISLENGTLLKTDRCSCCCYPCGNRLLL